LNISNQIDISDFKLINELKQKYKVVGVVAELTKRKGIDQVINALVQLPDCALVIVGDGKEKEKLIQLAIDNKVFDRVLFLGYKLNGASYIYQFDIFVMPSRSEGFGLSLIEAIACKKGVICSSIISFKGLFTKEEVTFFELENINSLVSALKQSIDINKTEKAFTKVNNYYTNSIMAANYKQLYLTIT
jgi:glycosyltransferase involved in cell wall biosynthesis